MLPRNLQLLGSLKVFKGLVNDRLLSIIRIVVISYKYSESSSSIF